MIGIKDIMFNILFKRDIKGCILFKYLSIKGCIQEHVSRVYSLLYSYYVHYYVQVIVKRSIYSIIIKPEGYLGMGFWDYDCCWNEACYLDLLLTTISWMYLIGLLCMYFTSFL